ncbi:IclR family transcriptional regulator domain-containing protein [Celeribacter litoreus]|uniref:IclR family transcriptional regulator domain-containing protein n=1 Tax=Celeribacter litoreus TaxID=2876714 RepID=UPI001CC9882D|nr:IclR family transcriptional regulator C-terminal domain-containing protein [Celeribacter litoreus]MCA0042891.1 helix-turn-helix domain-containing protein [Celeribacter litoreus]
MVGRSSDVMSSMVKGLRVLECFGAGTPKLTITDAAQMTGLDRATARRCLLTLHHAGYADYDGKFFTLTPRAMRLGMGAIASLPLPQIVQPWLDQLTEQIGQSCSVSILDGTEIVYLARAAQKRVMSIGLMPGSRLPAHCTSMGRVLLGALAPDEARAILEESDLSPRTKYSVTDPDAIMQKVEDARTNGYAIIDQEVEIGLRSIAVPLTDGRGNIVAALNTGMAATQDDPEALVQAYLPKLLTVQSGLKRML